MRKALVVVSMITFTLLLSSTVFAAAWNVPNNVRIVQKSNTDQGGRIYSSIQGAINSITNASAGNPYVVRVMPGVYNETVTMKEYVDVVGSSRDNTIITSSAVNADDWTCTQGTVIMANNSSIRNVKVVNSVATSNDFLAAGIVFNNVQAKAEEVNVLVGSSTVYGVRNNGICSVGGGGHAILNNVDIEAYSIYGHANGVLVRNDGKATISNSKVVASSDDTVQAVDCVGIGTGLGSVNITNSHIEGQSGNAPTGLWVCDCKFSISNSIVKVSDSAFGYAVAASHYDLTIINTQLVAGPGSGGIDWYPDSTGVARIANSQIQGGITNLTNMKLFNNFDENFNAIPNQ